MKKFVAVGLTIASSFLLSACGGGGGSNAVPSANGSGASTQSTARGTEASRTAAAGANTDFATVCPDTGAGTAACSSLQLLNTALAAPSATPGAPPGYGPSDLQTAYGLTAAAANNGSNATIAIVDAYFDYNIVTELNRYRAQYGLAACAHNSTNTGCFRVIDQRGNDPYTDGSAPSYNPGWAEETALDVDMVSANCPKCSILLVQTDSNSFADLGAGVNQAASPTQSNTSTTGAPAVRAISNSYGGGEGTGEIAIQNAYYNHPGIAITASAGDGGYMAQIPAAYNTVVAVGGTTLKQGGPHNGFTETVWSGTGSGCSGYIAKPAWQHDAGCPRRTIGDVAYVADPYTGVAVYSIPAGGFAVFGGTSASSPAIASIFGLNGNTSGTNGYPASLLYANRTQLYDVTSGANGSCYPAYLCHGEIGYDGPTGNGTPNGIGAF